MRPPQTDRSEDERSEGLEPLSALAPDGLLRSPEAEPDPVLRVLLERVRSASRPRERDDGHTVCLAIEGGGMRGAVTAGMCVVLEAAALTPAFDRVYGVSAGALNAWATAAGQAALSATHYQDAVERRVVRRTGPLRGLPMVDYELLFEQLIAGRKPLSFEQLARGPELRALATSLDTFTLRVLADFEDAGEVLSAVRASSFLPRFAGDPPAFRGERLADGAMLEPIPFPTPLAEGTTHLLVLRSRPATCRKAALSEYGELFAVRDDPALSEMLRLRQGTYNRLAAELQRGGPFGSAHVRQVAVPDEARLVGPLQANRQRIVDSLRAGALAMAQAILTVPVEVWWQPVVYRSGVPSAAGPPRA